jgi:hypothetical protein
LQEISFTIDADECDESTTTARCEVRDQSTLSTEPDAITGILDIASSDDTTIMNERCDADFELRVGRICSVHHFNRTFAELIPRSVLIYI